MNDTEPMLRVDLLPPPIPALPTHRSQPPSPHRLDRAGAPPRIARGTTPPPFVVPASLGYTEVAPSASWGTVEEIVLLDRPLATPPIEASTARRPTLAITAAACVAVAAIAAIALLAGLPASAAGDHSAAAPASTPPAVLEPTAAPAPIVVPIEGEEEQAADVELVSEDVESEAVEISEIDARILELLESGELPDEAAPAATERRTTTPPAARAAARPRNKDIVMLGARARKKGIVMLGAKPPCRILIDGKDTGLMTPQRDLRIAVGSHAITLINDEHGIRETLSVNVRPGKASRVIRDFTARLRRNGPPLRHGEPAVF